MGASRKFGVKLLLSCSREQRDDDYDTAIDIFHINIGCGTSVTE